MSTLVINPTYISHDVLYEADLDSIRVPLQNFLNVTKLEGSNFASGTLTESNLAASVQLTTVKSGTVLRWRGATLPEGYLWANGQTYTVTAQPQLYTAIGNTFGGTPGVNFQVPDRRDRISAGRDNMGGSAANRLTNASSGVQGDTIGATGGSQNLSAHTHTAGTLATALGAHTHALTDPGHDHPIFRGTLTSPTTSGYETDISVSSDGTVLSRTEAAGTTATFPNITYSTTGASHSHTGESGTVIGQSATAGTKSEQSVVQPVLVCNFIIKA